MSLNLSPQIEATLNAAAQQRGVDPTALVENIILEMFTPVEAQPTPELSEESKALIALMDKWIADTPTDPDEIRKAEADRDEFIETLNRNRVESGETPLFP